jgi:hypothetical protein
MARAPQRSQRPHAGMGDAERSAALAQIARSWLERERSELLAAATRAQKRSKARCLAAAREHLSRSERTGDPGDAEPAAPVGLPGHSNSRPSPPSCGSSTQRSWTSS